MTSRILMGSAVEHALLPFRVASWALLEWKERI